MGRIILTSLGLIGALVWAAAFMRAPGAAMEVLLAVSPIVVTVWLVLMLTMRHHEPRTAGLAPPTPTDSAAVLARDGRRCHRCGAARATTVVARRPARRHEPDPLARFISLCSQCAAESPLRSLPASR